MLALHRYVERCDGRHCWCYKHRLSHALATRRAIRRGACDAAMRNVVVANTIVGQPHIQLIEHVMPRRGIDPRMPQRLLCFPNIAFGELRAHEAPEVVRLNMAEADLIRIPLHGTPHVDR